MNLVLYSILISFLICIRCESQLKHVHILFRHGDRSPTEIYPTDINKANKWPRGLGQLTEEGIRQQFQLGIWLRARYSSLIGPILNNSDIHVRSTDIDRTLMSAESNLAGFVYNEQYQIIPNLPWRPISIHTVREYRDYSLQFNICPVYIKKRKALYNSDYFKNQFAPYQSLLLYIRKKSGLLDLTFYDIWKFYDVLFCEKTHNMTVNDWITTDLWNKLLKINVLNWELMFYDDLARLSGGLLLYNMVHRIINVTTNDPYNKDGLKYVMYSAHDTDVAPIAKLLGFYDNVQPPYASCIILELYQQSTNGTTPTWAVKVLYKNDSDAHAHIVPGCQTELCPLPHFLEVTKDKVMSRSQFMHECGLEWSLRFWVSVVFGVVCAAVLITVCVMFLVRRQRQRMPGATGSGARYARFNDDKCIN